MFQAVARFLCCERSVWQATTMPVGMWVMRTAELGRVDVLAAGAGRAVGVDAAVALVDLDLDLVVDDRIDPDRGEAGVAPGVRSRTARCAPADGRPTRSSASHGRCALDDDRRRLDARLIARGLFDQLDLELSALGPARVHAQQHPRPVAALGAAGAGMDLDDSCRWRRPRRKAAPRARRRSPSALSALSAAIPSASTASSPSVSARSTSVAASSRSRSIFASEPSRSSSIVRSRITFSASSGSVQRLGSSDLAFSSARRRVAASTSKMPPQQSHGLLDQFDQLFGFGAHDPNHQPENESNGLERLPRLEARTPRE